MVAILDGGLARGPTTAELFTLAMTDQWDEVELCRRVLLRRKERREGPW